MTTQVAARRSRQPTEATVPSPARTRTRFERTLVAAAVVASCVAAPIQLLDVALPGRSVLALAFVLLAPGVPVAVLLRLRNGAAAVALGVAVSLSSLLLVSTLLLVGDAFRPAVAVAGLAVLTALLAPFAWRSAGAWQPADEERSVAQRQRGLLRTLSAAAVVGALVLWWVQVQGLPVDDIGGTGVIGVVDFPYVAALVVLAAVAAVQLAGRTPDHLVMSAVALALVVVLFGLLNLADSAASFRTAYVHVGFIDHITDTGQVARGYDARFSWPGFFAAGAVLVDLAGLPDATPLIRLAPVVFNALAVPALLAIGTVVGGSRRAAWCGVLLYLCMNWFSQDYLSPQATVLLLYAGVVAALLVSAQLQPQDGVGLLRRVLLQVRRVPDRPAWLSPARAVALELSLVLVCVAMVVSHQLTPVTLIGILLAFTLSGTTRYRLLWLVAAVAFLGWFSYGAEDFWRGHLDQVFGDVGQLGTTLGSSVGARLHGDPTYGAMQQLRLAASGAWLLLAAAGLWLRRQDERVGLVAALAFGPFVLLALQSYGGEVLLRCFVYALPALAPLVAVVVLRAVDLLPRVWLRTVPLAALLLVAALLLTATRGSNAGFERISASHLEAVRIMLAAVPPDSRVGLPADAGPLGVDRLVEVDSITLDPDHCEQAGVLADDVVACVLAEEVDYVLVTSTMDVLGQLRYGRPRGWTEDVVQRLTDSRVYFRVQTRQDAVVLAHIDERRQ